jgi:hypothetical protein
VLLREIKITGASIWLEIVDAFAESNPIATSYGRHLVAVEE